MAETKDKKKRELDDAQKNAVKINVNSVVSAGAGSGKTTVLADRFSSLLVNDKDCRVEQILTLTFTKKATVEMNDRIYKKLYQACPEKAKDFYKANIKTIDSYCAQVAKLGCNNFGISPDFTQDDDAIFQKSYDMALKYILKNRNEEIISSIRGDTKYDAAAQQIFVNFANIYSNIVKPFDWDYFLNKQRKFIFDKWNECCFAINQKISDIESFLAELNKPKKLQYEINLLEEISNVKNNPVPAIDFSEYESQSRKKYIESVYKLSKVGKRTGSNHDYDEIKKIHEEIANDVDCLLQIENYIYGGQFVLGLIPYLNDFKKMVDDVKRTTGMLTFNDVSSLAIEILENYPELRQVEKEKYKYIMIDEFQDNNEMQKKLLYLISEKLNRTEKGIPRVDELIENKLFFVGDEKQSIYRFRGAEVSVFRALAQEFADGFLELKVNYRSHQALIAAFNSIFGGYNYPPSENEILPENKGVFYSYSDVKKQVETGIEIPQYEAIYHKVDISKDAKNEVEECILKTKSEKLPDIYKPRVTIAMIDNDAKPENSDSYLDIEMSEAVWVTNKISELLKEGYEENDIAILFRALTIQPMYEKLLLKKGIAYKTESVTNFFSDGPVNDLVSYLTLIAYKTDSNSFAKVLHSSFVNLSFAEIEIILSSFDTTKELFLQSADGILSGKSLERFCFARDIYVRAVEISQTKNLTDLISYLWYDAGYRFETMLSQRKFMYNSSYDRLFELARLAEVDNQGLAEFIDYVSTFKTEKLDGIKIPFEYADGVNLLTIHKSKGLEYPVVFVVGCGRSAKPENNSDIMYFSNDYGVTVNTPKSPASFVDKNIFYEKQKTLSKRQSAAELRRVTYVALTRAEKRLFISGKYHFTKWEDGSNYDERPDVDTIFGIMKPALKTYISSEMKIKDEYVGRCPFEFEIIDWALKEEGYLEDNSKKEIIEKFIPYFNETEVVTKEIIQSPYAKPSHLHDEDDETYKTGFSKIIVDKAVPYSEIDQLVNDSISSDKNEPDFAYSNFGTIAHSYLECAVKNIEPQMLNTEITGLHGNEKKIAIVDKVCREMNEKFLKSDTGKLLLKTVEQNKFYKSEYDFKSKAGGKIINGQIDLVFENPDDDGYTIVDYKTNHEIRPEIYYTQLACYRNAVANMMNINEDKIRCVLFYLRFGESVDITEECAKINLEDLIINTYN